MRRLIKQDKLNIEKVIIFGSQTKRQSRKWSDIDLCIISPQFKNRMETLKFLWTRREDNEILEGLEPIGFSDKDFKQGSCLINEIKKTGIRLKV
ncbi:MAG: nucleotidyltransferase [Parcubacteria group bacterium Athens1014_10]|nr:MAG: nucleotidyltransferase [Parcubacteria group bacterium Athens1014_10]TSD04743.1 MAG: nucleotidyltransferase [Parcubacteria group bacterium Athens0714_12]